MHKPQNDTTPQDSTTNDTEATLPPEEFHIEEIDVVPAESMMTMRC